MNGSTAKKPKGNEAARDARRELNVLWAKSHRVIASFIRSMVIDYHKSEDVLQETASAVAEKFDDYDRSRPFLPWVLGIARFKIIDALRVSSRDRLVFSQDIIDGLTVTYSELEIDASDVQIALEKCVSRVTGRSRKLLELRYLRDLNPESIAASTGMTTGAVAISLHRIRKALAECIAHVRSGENSLRISQGGQT